MKSSPKAKHKAGLYFLSPAEVSWTHRRWRHLLDVESKDVVEARAIIEAEAVSKPWEAISSPSPTA